MTLEQSVMARPCPSCGRRVFPHDVAAEERWFRQQIRDPQLARTVPGGLVRSTTPSVALHYRCDPCSRRRRREVAWQHVITDDERALIDEEAALVQAEYDRRYSASAT